MSKVKDYVIHPAIVIARDWKTSVPLGLAGLEFGLFTVAGPDFWDKFGDWTNYGLPFHAANAAHFLLGFGANRAGRGYFRTVTDDYTNSTKEVLSGISAGAIASIGKELLDTGLKQSLSAIGIDDLSYDALGMATDNIAYMIKSYRKR